MEGFAPLVDQHSRVLILGSMPSVQSLAKGQYYGNARNAFWPILFALWGDQPPEDYSLRCAFAREKGIALWDTLAGCERAGSLDSAIRNPVANNFCTFFAAYPHIESVFFNGQAAFRFFARLVAMNVLAGRPYQILPSTSPARAMPFADKLAAWQAVYHAASGNNPRISGEPGRSVCGPASDLCKGEGESRLGQRPK